ncbi:MAG: sulfatase [Planctomycetota bacterium]|nr:sulfatase [Planctomycetota bacterium]
MTERPNQHRQHGAPKVSRDGVYAQSWTGSLALGVLALIASCAKPDLEASESAVQHIARLNLTVIPGSPEPTKEILSRGRFEVGPESPTTWQITGADSELVLQSKERWGGPWIGLGFSSPKGRVAIPQAIPAGSVNRAAVRLMCKSKVDVAVALTRNGEDVVTSAFLRHSGTGLPGVVFVDIPGVLGQSKPFDGVRVLIDRLKHNSVFLGVELLSAPLHGFLPKDPSQPEAVGMENEYRTAIALSKDAPMTAEVLATPGAVLKFGMARPLEVRRTTEHPRILVRVTDMEQEPPVEIAKGAFNLPRGRDSKLWVDAELVLPLAAPGRVQVSFSLHSAEEGPSLVALSSPRIERRWAGPKTVVLVTSDTHRADHVGGSSRNVGVETPFLDQLAGKGVMFEDAYASTNITNPSHASLMTALSPRDTRMVDNNTVLAEHAVTLAERYQQAGYFTLAALSAGHMNHRQSGLSQGFDRLWVPSGKADVDSRISIARLDEWLDEADGLPLFVWLHVFDAHAPYQVPDELRWRYYDESKDPYSESMQLPEGVRVPWDAAVRDLDYVTSQYMSEVTYLDTQLEGFLSNPRFQNAVIAITGDHGESFGNHGLYFTHAGLYPETLGVPLILTWPGSPMDVAVTRGVNHLDLGRTLLDVSGLVDVEFPGENLMRWLGDAERENEARYAISSHAHSASIELDGWFLVLALRNSGKPVRAQHQVELYRLADDPGCLVDLIDEEMERARSLRTQLLAWLAAADEGGLSRATGLQDREELAQLAALGYADQGIDEGTEAGAWYEEDPKSQWCKRFR